jgi:hypothetical protein
MGITADYTRSELDPDAAFPGSLDHILAELGRIHVLVHAQVNDARRFSCDDGNIAGLSISEGELDALLAHAPGENEFGCAGDGWVDTHHADQSNDDRADIARRRDGALRSGTPLRLERLVRLFGLTPFDIDALLICLLPEIDLRYERANRRRGY